MPAELKRRRLKRRHEGIGSSSQSKMVVGVSVTQYAVHATDLSPALPTASSSPATCVGPLRRTVCVVIGLAGLER